MIGGQAQKNHVELIWKISMRGNRGFLRNVKIQLCSEDIAFRSSLFQKSYEILWRRKIWQIKMVSGVFIFNSKMLEKIRMFFKISKIMGGTISERSLTFDTFLATNYVPTKTSLSGINALMGQTIWFFAKQKYSPFWYKIVVITKTKETFISCWWCFIPSA